MNLNGDDGMSRFEGKCHYLITISKHSNLWLRRLMPDMNDPLGSGVLPSNTPHLEGCKSPCLGVRCRVNSKASSRSNAGYFTGERHLPLVIRRSPLPWTLLDYDLTELRVLVPPVRPCSWPGKIDKQKRKVVLARTKPSNKSNGRGKYARKTYCPCQRSFHLGS
jgi:hypothetical protein